MSYRKRKRYEHTCFRDAFEIFYFIAICIGTVLNLIGYFVKCVVWCIAKLIIFIKNYHSQREACQNV